MKTNTNKFVTVLTNSVSTSSDEDVSHILNNLYHFQANVPETCSRISPDTNGYVIICTFSLQTLMNNLFKINILSLV